MYDVAIVGAGIAGMATAARLQARGLATIVLESHGQPGGTTSSTTSTPRSPVITCLSYLAGSTARSGELVSGPGEFPELSISQIAIGRAF